MAAWRQAARGEHAALTGSHYGQLLVDLVKAFERVSHAVLVREAIALGFPLYLLRLSLQAYRMGNIIRIGSATSRVMTASRGISAGSGFATFEMRIVMILTVDSACRVCLMAQATL